ncbi:MAG: hypothetical protein IPG69_10040 [Flavobacteriales bacterium]|nr:hypothetical protein [Flavobacteriales bacterium]
MKPTAAVVVNKEYVGSLVFPSEPVRLSPDHRAQLLRKVDRALHLGNGEHGKCRILFRDTEGLKAVETTIWSVDDKAIVLKYGHAIPLVRVIDFEMPL